MSEEEVARPYTRSANRCHLITRIPIFDQNGMTKLYYLQFTSGNVLSFDDLKPVHVPHILTGFLIRRPVSTFVGSNSSVMIPLPLCRELVQLRDKYPTGRLIIHVRDNEEPDDEKKFIMTTLRRHNVRFACDINCIRAADRSWADKLHLFSYVVIKYSRNYAEDLAYFNELRHFNPRIKCITAGDDLQDIELRRKVMEMGSDLILSVFCRRHDFYADKGLLLRYSDVFALVREVMREETDFVNTARILGRYPFMQRDVFKLIRFFRPEYKGIVWPPGQAVELYHEEYMRAILGVITLHALAFIATQSGSSTASNSNLEPVKTALIRGYYLYTMAYEIGLDERMQMLAFIMALFSVERTWSALINPRLSGQFFTYDFTHGQEETFEVLLASIMGLEQCDLPRFAKTVIDAGGSVSLGLHAYEAALLWSNQISDLLYSVNYCDFIVTFAADDPTISI
ncbi:MAG: hypothetical protein IAB19_01645 [Proteobacteria bacterium]|uniref:HDOD domain-containing protein n=1 Tax=Candidatus Avisuccinivibrio stercorigallinarum TaxID=2840704 RepID=A0A9D9D8G5_9GAMM|nr:hypothetical protein [Candidatus Avisuccinivibrio stercorigallinarum]